MDKEEFEKRKNRLVRNGLNIINGLKETFQALLDNDWYGKFEYPEIEVADGTTIKPESVDIQILFKRIISLNTELVKYHHKLKSLWEEGLK